MESTERTVTLTIDGTEVTVREGATLLDACRKLEIDTPTLCYGDTLQPANACRVCMVELEKARTLVPACSRKAEDGMVVHTDSDARPPQPPGGVRAARLLGRPVDHADRAAVSGDLRRQARAVRAAGAARSRPRTPPGRPSRRSRRPDRGDRRRPGQGRQRPVRPRLLQMRALLQVRRRLRRPAPEYVRHRGRRQGVRRPHLDRVRGAAARVGVRVLRQLHPGVPDRRADGEPRARAARVR